MQSAGIGAEHPHHGPGSTICDRRPIRGVLNAESPARPRAVLLERRRQEVEDMPEANQALVERRRDQETLRHRLNKRPIYINRRARDRRRERRFAAAPAHAYRGIARLAKRPGQKPPLPI